MLVICAADQNSAMVLGPMPGSLSSSRCRCRILRLTDSALGKRASGGDGLNVGGMLLPIPGNLEQAFGVGDDGQSRRPWFVPPLGGATVAENAKAVGPIDGHEVGGLGQQKRNGGVIHSKVSATSIND